MGIFKGDLFVLEYHERSQLIQQITSFKAVQLDQLGSQNSPHGQHTNVNLTTALTSALPKLYARENTVGGQGKKESFILMGVQFMTANLLFQRP